MPPRFDEDGVQEAAQNADADDAPVSFNDTDMDIISAPSVAPHLMPPSIQSVDDPWWTEACQWQAALAMAQGVGHAATAVQSVDAASTQPMVARDGGQHLSGTESSSGDDPSCTAKGSDGGVSRNGTAGCEIVSKEATTANGGGAQLKVDATLVAKQLKAQRRRERNRACAQRSNQRAKASRDRLVTNLKGCKEQVEVLRAKEMELRKENLKLRKSVAELS